MSNQLPSSEKHSRPLTAVSEQAEAPTMPVADLSDALLSEPREQAAGLFDIEEEPSDLETAFVAPFQRSSAMPQVPAAESEASHAQADSVSSGATIRPTRSRGLPRRSLFLIVLLICLVGIIGLLVMSALAQTTPLLQARAPHVLPGTPSAQQPLGQHPLPTPSMMPPLPTPTSVPLPISNGQAANAQAWIPQPLPTGWTQAGLLTADAIEALRTAVAFTDREMSLDYRSVGTRAVHGGTFTAATFILTPAAQQRFIHNDVRAINNTLFDRVAQQHVVRQVINPQPHLMAFAQQGQQSFAWVDVTFSLWQSQLDPANPTHLVEGPELDALTHQPRMHHMQVVLLRVPAQAEGNAPAMGGTGWLVSTYGLDVPAGTMLTIIPPA